MDYNGTAPLSQNNVKTSEPSAQNQSANTTIEIQDNKCAKPAAMSTRSNEHVNCESDSDIKDKNYEATRRALSVDRKSDKKRSSRQIQRQADLKADRDFRYHQRKGANKTRPDSPMPPKNMLDIQAAFNKISELENIILSLKAENAKLTAPSNTSNQTITATVHHTPADDVSSSEDEADRTIVDTNQNSDGFQLVRKKNRQQVHQKIPTPPVQISENMYDILPHPSVVSNYTNRESPPTTSSKQTKPVTQLNPASTINAATQKRSKRPPPIIAYDLPVKTINAAVPATLGNYTLKKVNNNCTHVLTETNAAHHSMQEILKSAKVSFHSYTPRDNRRIYVVLRNLCSSYDETDVLRAINDLNLNITLKSVTQFATEKSRREKTNLKMWLVVMESGSDVEALLKTKKLLHQIVCFEHRQTKGIAQCHNCQHFGHSSANCSRPYRCVKCTSNHLPGQCAITTLREESQIPVDPKCVNCNGNHPANWRGCAAYSRYINIKSERQNEARTKQEQRQSSYQNVRQPHISYAAVASQQVNNHPPTHTQPTKNTTGPKSNLLDFLETECNSKFGVDFGTLLNKASQFVPQYITLNEKDKPMALLKFAMSVAPAPNQNA